MAESNDNVNDNDKKSFALVKIFALRCEKKDWSISSSRHFQHFHQARSTRTAVNALQK
jgi:hypothetical protein